MKLSLDTASQQLTIEKNGVARNLPLYSPEAFELLSDQWVRVGWSLGYYNNFTWLGQPVLQLPEDLVRMQEVIFTLRPDLIVETGVFLGGSLVFYASVLAALGKGHVVGVEKNVLPQTRDSLNEHALRSHMSLVEGDSVAQNTLAQVAEYAASATTVMVILDSDHKRAHVLEEIKHYSRFVTEGSCLVVADTVIAGFSDVPGGDASWAEGSPAAAVSDFLEGNTEFDHRAPQWRHHASPIASTCSYWPAGWLWRR